MVRSKRQSRRQGFTLVELIFAITILSFLATITAGALKRTAAGNRRVACMTNLHNLHQALRMYKLDEGQYPAFDPLTNPASPGPGLWALFTYQSRDPAVTANRRFPTDEPETGYMGSPKSLHCPEDKQHSTATNPTAGLEMYYYDVPNATSHQIDTYNSYQVLDDWDWQTQQRLASTSSLSVTERRNRYTYLTDRTGGVTTQTRQLQPTSDSSWQAAETTVVTWCPWHRGRSKPNYYDLVLYLDGQVDFLAMPTDNASNSTWTRLPVQGTVQ